MAKEKIHNIKSTGFKTPDNYFQDLEASLANKIEVLELSESIKNTGFKIPEGYLEIAENTILKKVSYKKETKVVSLFNKRNIRYLSSSIAAAVALFISIFLFNKKDPLPTFVTLENETVEDYILTEVSTYDMTTLLNKDQLNETIHIDSSLSEENIEDYLLNNVDIEDLITE